MTINLSITGAGETYAEAIGRVSAYLPDNYNVDLGATYAIPATPAGPGHLAKVTVIVSGCDDHGWTAGGYVIPRLASGGMWGKVI